MLNKGYSITFRKPVIVVASDIIPIIDPIFHIAVTEAYRLIIFDMVKYD